MRKVILILLIALLPSQFVFAEPIPRVNDQGNTKMCVVYAVTNAVELEMERAGLDVPKEGFDMDLLWNECVKTDNPSDGLYIKTALDVAMNQGLYALGANPEKDEPYCKIATYSAINVSEIRDYVSSSAIVIIQTHYQPKNWSDGLLEYSTEKKSKLDHTTFLIDYDQGVFRGVNSWGWNWGICGFYYASPEWLEHNCVYAYIVKLSN